MTSAFLLLMLKAVDTPIHFRHLSSVVLTQTNLQLRPLPQNSVWKRCVWKRTTWRLVCVKTMDDVLRMTEADRCVRRFTHRDTYVSMVLRQSLYVYKKQRDYVSTCALLSLIAILLDCSVLQQKKRWFEDNGFNLRESFVR